MSKNHIHNMTRRARSHCDISFLLTRSNWQYTQIAPLASTGHVVEKSKRCSGGITLVITILGAICFISGAAFGSYLSHSFSGYQSLKSTTTCTQPSLRQEWRSLSEDEKLNYIRAVQCLKDKPSQLGLNQSLYDDFPWVHMQYGESSHEAAQFLAWHRLFIHVYEQKLKGECRYKGHLAYWDWTLDWEDISQSPIWDNVYGFGGSGNTSSGPTTFYAHCVTEGPFANLEIPYFENIYRPHCLLRGFGAKESLRSLRDAISPKSLETLHQSPDYRTLNLGLEHGLHINIPRSINGDFGLHTAPAGKLFTAYITKANNIEPVFFLHHTQLDRQWWRWQQERPEVRAMQYIGKAATNSSSAASLQDVLEMGNLADSVKVADIMLTESGILCYRY